MKWPKADDIGGKGYIFNWLLCSESIFSLCRLKSGLFRNMYKMVYYLKAALIHHAEQNKSTNCNSDKKCATL